MKFKINILLKVALLVLILFLIGSNVSYAFSMEKIENFETKTIHDDHLEMKDKVAIYLPILVTLTSLLIFLGGKDISFVTKVIAGALFLLYIVALFLSDGQLVFSLITIAFGVIVNLIFLLNENVSGSGKVLSAITIAYIVLNAIIVLIK
jgi:hypothetical protein